MSMRKRNMRSLRGLFALLGDQAHCSRDPGGYFARSIGHVLLELLLGGVKEEENPLTADEWIACRTVL